MIMNYRQEMLSSISVSRSSLKEIPAVAAARVITVGDYTEAYTRHNPDNFRMNIAAGGKSHPYMLKKEEKDFCYAIMKRSKFPFAHIDIMITENGNHHLTEISLNGGIKGASISRKELDKKKAGSS